MCRPLSFDVKFRGVAHGACNVNYQLPSHIPVFFHNLSGYDAHFIIERLTSFGRKVHILLKEGDSEYLATVSRLTTFYSGAITETG